MASVGSILSGAFRLFREKPATVAIWGLVFVVISLASNLPSYFMQGTQPNPVPFAQPDFMSVIGMIVLAVVVMLVYTSVMMCAVFRAVLRPDESSFASIRLGMDELRMMGLYLILMIGAVFIWVICVLLLMLLVGGAALSGSGVATFLVAGVGYLGLIGGLIFVSVRLSLVFALSFARRRLAIDEAWSLTRGRFWMLFAVYLILVLIAIVLYLVAVAPFMGPFFSAMSEAIRNPGGDSAQALELAGMNNFTLQMLILMSLATALVQTVLHTLNGSATATAVRELLNEQGEALEDDVERTAQIFE